MSNANKAWEAIFAHLDIPGQLDERGQASVTAQQIKDITSAEDGLGHQEPRIITKFDAREHRPAILRQHNCTILATSNGTYSVLRGDGYHDTEHIHETIDYNSEKLHNLETLPDICTSESQVIDSTAASGLLSDFLEDNDLALTIRGRLRSGEFDFQFDEHEVQVNGVQIEVDAGYEGKKIYLIEAKMGTKDNFIIRQLYYPYRMWNIRNTNKEIVPVFISYSDKTFYIYQYRFNEHTQYNSIELVKSGAYILGEKAAKPEIQCHFSDNKYLLQYQPGNENLEVPFPQADDLRKVIDSIFAVASGFSTTFEISSHYEFDERQSYYYGNAARYLGLLDLDHNEYALTDAGNRYINSSKEERKMIIINAMMDSPTINDLAKETIKNHTTPSYDRISNIIQYHRHDINHTTANRRAHTMAKWLEWLTYNFNNP
ncbi:type II restriction enzyme [Thiohalophilus sp.]|uniref:type II restriction enzyme n=1 Tax=Thiohalophilus sp. TaxID=3028392 RepID=UPI002ACEC116|nr:AAA-associated domain-containing protein [Thiohalophilus sp.]MDZ7660917.1 AAA-associated domain-containing protein [Thiohalophilus sp.]